MDIHAWGKPKRNPEQFHLMADHFTDFPDELCVPCLCQKRAYGNGRAVLIVSRSRFFFWLAKEAALKGIGKAAGKDLPILDLVFFIQAQACRAVGQGDACNVPWSGHGCCCCLRGGAGDGLSGGTEGGLPLADIACGKCNKLVLG